MEEVADRSLEVIRYSRHYKPLPRLSRVWFDLRVFYVRISNLQVNDTTPDSLTVNHIPLDPDTLLEVNGSRRGLYSDGVRFHLRRDKADRKSEGATFVSTNNIRHKGSVKFEVLVRDDLILSGVLEMCNPKGVLGNSKNNLKRKWTMSCEPGVGSVSSFPKKTESLPLSIEVYIAGCFSGSPIILTKTLQFSTRRKHASRSFLNVIPENETECSDRDESIGEELQFTEYQRKTDDEEYCNNDMYWRRMDYVDGDDGELSWFNAGVRVGVGIGLGICVGIGVGVGLLVRTYQSTTRNFRRRLV